MRNGGLAFSLLSAACVGAAVRPVVFPAAIAAAATEHCEWRYLLGPVDVPEGGDNSPMGHGVGSDGCCWLSARAIRRQHVHFRALHARAINPRLPRGDQRPCVRSLPRVALGKCQRKFKVRRPDRFR